MKKTDIPEKICAYCEHATLSADSDMAHCKYKGEVSPDRHCLRFTFDPLKLNYQPKKLKKIKMETL